MWLRSQANMSQNTFGTPRLWILRHEYHSSKKILIYLKAGWVILWGLFHNSEHFFLGHIQWICIHEIPFLWIHLMNKSINNSGPINWKQTKHRQPAPPNHNQNQTSLQPITDRGRVSACAAGFTLKLHSWWGVFSQRGRGREQPALYVELMFCSNTSRCDITKRSLTLALMLWWSW